MFNPGVEYGLRRNRAGVSRLTTVRTVVPATEGLRSVSLHPTAAQSWRNQFNFCNRYSRYLMWVCVLVGTRMSLRFFCLTLGKTGLLLSRVRDLGK